MRFCRAEMPSYCVKALENTQSILCGLFLVCEHFCSGRTASHRTALDFRGIFVLLDAGGLSPAKDKRAKSTEKAGCPTCVPLLIDANEETTLSTPTAKVSGKTPQDVLDEAFQQINTTLADDLLSEVMKQPPAFFEHLVVKLLMQMGYGGSVDNAGTVIGQTGDEGIDGIIREDKLGFSLIYIQAKRWDYDKTVGRPEIQKFVGALAGQGASKGLFITTAKFTKEACQYAEKQHTTKVVLVDGTALAKLMIEYNLGVSTEATYEIKRIDSDFFAEDLD